MYLTLLWHFDINSYLTLFKIQKTYNSFLRSTIYIVWIHRCNRTQQQFIRDYLNISGSIKCDEEAEGKWFILKKVGAEVNTLIVSWHKYGIRHLGKCRSSFDWLITSSRFCIFENELQVHIDLQQYQMSFLLQSLVCSTKIS